MVYFLICFGAMPFIKDLFTIGMQWLHAKAGGKPSGPYDDYLVTFFVIILSIDFTFLDLVIFIRIDISIRIDICSSTNCT